MPFVEFGQNDFVEFFYSDAPKVGLEEALWCPKQRRLHMESFSRVEILENNANSSFQNYAEKLGRSHRNIHNR